jgi:hypothetical protein
MPDDALEHRGAVGGDDVVAEGGLVDVVPFRDLLQGLIHRRDAMGVMGPTRNRTGRRLS